jgi:outer membrane protein TolC
MRGEIIRQEILKALGLHPEANITFKPQSPLFLNEVSQESGHLKISDNHPLLSRFSAEYEAAEKRLHLEIRKQYSDLILSPLYGVEEDLERRGIGLSLALPLWNRNRQAIAEAIAARDLARRRLESGYEDLVHQLDVASKKLDASQRMLEVLKDVTIPLADLQLDEVRKLLEVGEIDVLLIKDALAGSLRSKREVLEMRVEESQAINTVQFVLAPTAWVTLENRSEAK